MQRGKNNGERAGAWAVNDTLFLGVFFYLFEKQKERSLIHEFTPQMPITAGAGPSGHQEPGTQSGFPTWVAGTEALEPSCVC